mgnify:CR=1 FL=1
MALKLVYKPRSLKIEKVYFDFLGKINAGCKYEMYEPKILDCQEYGWRNLYIIKVVKQRMKSDGIFIDLEY